MEETSVIINALEEPKITVAGKIFLENSAVLHQQRLEINARKPRGGVITTKKPTELKYVMEEHGIAHVMFHCTSWSRVPYLYLQV